MLADDEQAKAAAEADVVAIVNDDLAPCAADMAPGTLLIDHGKAGAAMLLELGRPVACCAPAPGPGGGTALVDIINGRATARSQHGDIVCYQAAQIGDWEAGLATSSLFQAWQQTLGTSFQLEFAAPS